MTLLEAVPVLVLLPVSLIDGVPVALADADDELVVLLELESVHVALLELVVVAEGVRAAVAEWVGVLESVAESDAGDGVGVGDCDGGISADTCSA